MKLLSDQTRAPATVAVAACKPKTAYLTMTTRSAKPNSNQKVLVAFQNPTA
jgi:hypothetical protein